MVTVVAAALAHERLTTDRSMKHVCHGHAIQDMDPLDIVDMLDIAADLLGDIFLRLHMLLAVYMYVYTSRSCCGQL
jgi:hypothetical protein